MSFNAYAFITASDGIPSQIRANVTQNQRSSGSAKRILSDKATQGSPRSIKDTFTRTNSLEEVSFGLSNRYDRSSPKIQSPIRAVR